MYTMASYELDNKVGTNLYRSGQLTEGEISRIVKYRIMQAINDNINYRSADLTYVFIFKHDSVIEIKQRN